MGIFEGIKKFLIGGATLREAFPALFPQGDAKKAEAAEDGDMPWIGAEEVWEEKDIIRYRSNAKQAIIDALIEDSPQQILTMIGELFTVEAKDTYYESFVEVFKELISEGVIVKVGEILEDYTAKYYQEVGHPEYYNRQAERLRNLKNDIVKLLKDKGVKMPASDIDAYLKYQNVDKIKRTCEEMYQDDEISYAGNGRYFILTEEKKKPKKTSAPKSEEVDVEKELEKLKGLLDKGLITQDQYDAKSNELLGL